MAFNLHSLKLIIDLTKDMPKPVKIVCMGYPDVLIAPDVLVGTFDLGKLEIRDDSKEVLAWHGKKTEGVPEVVESTWLLKALGFAPRYIDITPARGGEIIMDMNQPVGAEALLGYFDLVYDAGGLEHYFNVGQAIKNMRDLTRVGGVIYHGNPCLAMNHGFFNFCPDFYFDFYHHQGDKLLAPIQGLRNSMPAGQLPAKQRFHLATTDELWMQVLVRKENANPVTWPIQAKYRANPGLKGKA